MKKIWYIRSNKISPLNKINIKPKIKKSKIKRRKKYDWMKLLYYIFK
jgi:hypothetical protein